MGQSEAEISKEIGNKHLVLGLLDDVTAQKRIDFELTKYRQALIGEGRDGNIMMVVDDMPANRAILKKDLFGSIHHH